MGVVLLDKRSKALFARRAQRNGVTSADTVWQFPQGGIDKGETPLEAARRELHEETGVKSVTFLAEARLHEEQVLHHHLGQPEELRNACACTGVET